MKRVQVVTMGCSKNRVDSEHLMRVLQERGYELVPETTDLAGGGVDEVIINTCGFIQDAKEESIGAILEAVEAKKQGLIGKVSVFGCLSQRYLSELPVEIPEVDEWRGVLTPDTLGRVLTTPSHYAYLKISEGCDRTCSYCAIPLIRGPHVSVPVEDLVEEARGLAAQGVKELIVIAQDTTYYGLDRYGKRTLARLLEQLARIDGIEWIRLHYSYPAGFPDDVLRVMADNPKLCPYIDIPLQHSADKVLSMMRRGVDGRQTRELVARMRRLVPGVVLRTTLIVGHPGEGEAEFRDLLDFVQESRFERLGAFTYSEEEGTYGALHYRDEIPAEVKQERYDRLMELQSSISLAYNRSRIGTRTRVLVDSVDSSSLAPTSSSSPAPTGDLILVARSMTESPEVDGEILIGMDSVMPGPDEPVMPGPDRASDLVGKFIDVNIIGADEYDLMGEIVTGT
ncbi:MAG: MiaB/RimO family radical SAM methylthiotransferase [Bacteroidales bacterium]|nr:MiaB/RimO family radical SAM methylthiotransferase [Bacteroidales bacterium]